MPLFPATLQAALDDAVRTHGLAAVIRVLALVCKHNAQRVPGTQSAVCWRHCARLLDALEKDTGAIMGRHSKHGQRLI